MALTGNRVASGAETDVRRQVMEKLVKDLRTRAQTVANHGSDNVRADGRLAARTRIERLIDPGTAFLEIGQFAAFDAYPDAETASAGIVAGAGLVEGRLAMIVANDATVNGGSYFPLTVKKHLRAQEIAEQNRLPCIYLVDSNKVNLPRQDDLFPDRDHLGRILFNQARMSAAGIPQIAVAMGESTAASSIVSAMADQAIIVRNQGTISVGGPLTVKVATGEKVTAEELGGADIHARTSGIVDHVAQDDTHALMIVRSAMATVKPGSNAGDRREPVAPRFDPGELDVLAPADPGSDTDVHDIIARIVDDSEFDALKPLYGPSLVTGFARVEGIFVGIVANNGMLCSKSAQKGAQFIELCGSRQIPLLFLQNIAGFTTGRACENEGIAQHAARLISAVARSTVPRITVVIGGSFGLGNFAMCGRAMSPRFLWVWPNARIGVFDSDQAASVLAAGRSAGFTSADEEEAFKASIHARHDRQASAWYGSARLWDDGIIAPADTRRVVALSLAVALNAPIADTRGLFGTAQ